MDARWLSISEYARHHQLSDMTVRRRIKNGRLRAVLREGKYYIEQGGQRPNSELSYPEPHSQAQMFADRVFEDSLRRSEFTQPEADKMERPYVVPKDISTPLLNQDQVSVDTTRLLAYCESSLRQVKATEESIKREWDAKVCALKSEIMAKNLAIQTLEQKVADLGMLLEAIEKPR